MQEDVKLDHEIMKIAKSAARKTNSSIDPQISKTMRLKTIKNNRTIEKEQNRKKEAFSHSEVLPEEQSPIIKFPGTTVFEQKELSKNTSYEDLMMMKIRQYKEKLKNDRNKK